MTTVNLDIDTITSQPHPLVLSSGRQVWVERLKTRQLMRLMKILTRGAGAALGDLRVSDTDTTADFVGQLVATILFAIPDAEDETVDFVRGMVTPVGLIQIQPGGHALSKAEVEINQNLLVELDEEFSNPELEDLVSVLEAVATVEAPHLVALGNRLAVLLKVQQSSRAAKKPAASSKPKSASSTPKDSSVGSPPPTTSSPRPTAGTTSGSETSR